MTQAAATNDNASRSRTRTMARVDSLDKLRGAHPEALRDLFAVGEPLDPLPLGDTRGALLAIESLTGAFLLTRPLVRAVSQVLPWRGKSFESGGTSGANVVLGRQLMRFHCEVEPSEIDGKPALVLRYDNLGNPWPVSAFVDEVRMVGERVCIGTASMNGRILFWWGLQL